jgi:hypothetical protein
MTSVRRKWMYTKWLYDDHNMITIWLSLYDQKLASKIKKKLWHIPGAYPAKKILDKMYSPFLKGRPFTLA